MPTFYKDAFHGGNGAELSKYSSFKSNKKFVFFLHGTFRQLLAMSFHFVYNTEVKVLGVI